MTKPKAVDDALFVSAAADGGTAEVALSKLGVEKATDPELKRFSQEMIDEHTALNKELLTLAEHKKFTLPRVVDSRAHFCLESLAGLQVQSSIIATPRPNSPLIKKRSRPSRRRPSEARVRRQGVRQPRLTDTSRSTSR